MSAATAPSLRTSLEQPTRPAGTLTYDERHQHLRREERVAVPDDCHVRPQVLDNLDDSAPLAHWSRGFLRRILLT